MSQAHTQNTTKVEQNLVCFAHAWGELVLETASVGLRKDQFRDALAEGMIVETEGKTVNKSCTLIGENAGNWGFFCLPSWGLNAGWSSLSITAREGEWLKYTRVLAKYLPWSNKENKDTGVWSNSALSSSVCSTDQILFARERGGPFCHSGAATKGWCDQTHAHSTHSSSKCSER